MMKKWIGGFLVVSTFIAFYFFAANDKKTLNASTPTSNVSSLTAAAHESPQSKNIPQEIQQRLDYADFQERTRQFFDQEKSLSQEDRQLQGKQINSQTEHFQQQGFLSATEALMLKLAVLKLTLNETDFAARGKEIVEQYKRDYDVAYEQWRATPDPQFTVYKEQEAQIVARVMNMNSFPNGLSRDEYLRRELERARIAAYQNP